MQHPPYAQGRSMLIAIVAVTLSVANLDATTQAYVDWLGYRVVEQGAVSADLATAWGAPRTVGRRYALLQPASGAEVYLRLVESPPTPGYELMRTHGWNANEILVEDPVALAAKLRDSPFRIVGEPRPLSTSSTVVAMQAVGPAGELNYFTRIPPEGATFVKTPARSFVDRTFIVVVGGASMSALQAFYRDVLGLTVSAANPARIGVLQAAWGQPDDATTPLAVASISPGFLVELDQYPAGAQPRPVRDGDLPPGMAMVSFRVASLAQVKAEWVVPPAVRAARPYSGKRSGVLRGAAGEWIELIE